MSNEGLSTEAEEGAAGELTLGNTVFGSVVWYERGVA